MAEATLLKKRKAAAIEDSQSQYLVSTPDQKRPHLLDAQESYLNSVHIPIKVLNAVKIITDYLQSTEV